MDPKTYVIITNKNEIKVYNAINELKKLNKNFYSVNILKVYNKIIDILLSKDTQSLQDIAAQLSNINYESLSEDDIYWDENYDYINANKLINNIKNNINTGDNYNKYSKELLVKEQIKINKALENTYSHNSEIYDKTETYNEIVRNTLSKDNVMPQNKIDKYTEEFNSLKRSYKDHKSSKIIENDILNISSCKFVYIESHVENIYHIIIGNLLPLNKQIDKNIKNINKLYSELVNLDIYQVEMGYSEIMLNFIDEFNSDPSQNKSELLETVKSNSEEYNNAPEEVKAKIDELINEVKDNNDPNYIYSVEDKRTLTALSASSMNKFTEQEEKNNVILSKINTLTSEVNKLKEQYKQKHNGEEYEHEPINDDQIQNPSYTIIDNVENIYSKKIEVVISLSQVNLEIDANSTVELIANISPETTPNKTIIWESSDTSIVTINPTQTQSGEQVNLTWVSEGNATITATSSYDNTKSETCNVVCKMEPIIEEPKYFYIGMNENNSVINTEDNWQVDISNINVDRYTNINEISEPSPGKLIEWKPGQTHYQYILLPESWYNDITLVPALGSIEASELHKIKIENTYYVILTWEDEMSAGEGIYIRIVYTPGAGAINHDPNGVIIHYQES